MLRRLFGVMVVMALSSCGPTQEELERAKVEKAMRGVEDASAAVDNAAAGAFGSGLLADPAFVSNLPQDTVNTVKKHCSGELDDMKAACQRNGMIGAAIAAHMEQRFADDQVVLDMIAACRRDYTSEEGVDYAQIGGCIRVGRGVSQ